MLRSPMKTSCDRLFKAGLALTLDLKLKTLFQFVYFCTSVYFKTSEKKTPFDSDKIPKEIFINKRLGNLL